MPDPAASLEDPRIAAARRRARRTGWIVAGIAVLIYAAFILTGAFGRV